MNDSPSYLAVVGSHTNAHIIALRDNWLVPVGWENAGGILCPVQPPTPEPPKMCSFICRNCGKETVHECEGAGRVPFDLGCAHCAEYALEYNGEKLIEEEEG